MGAHGAAQVSQPDNVGWHGRALQRCGLDAPLPLILSGLRRRSRTHGCAFVLGDILGQGNTWEGQKCHLSQPLPGVGRWEGSGASLEAPHAAWGMEHLSAHCCRVGGREHPAAAGLIQGMIRTSALVFLVTAPHDSRRAAQTPALGRQSSP